MTTDRIEALLALKANGLGAVGRDRIAMLEAIAKHGSITEAARAMGFSYKAVWDGVNAINNLLPRPALATQTGGRGGGGAQLTEDGRRLIVAFRRLEERLSRISQALVVDGPDDHADLLFWSMSMRTTAHNAFRCQVTSVRRAPVNVEVSLRLSDTNSIVAVITNDAADELAIVPGREAMALVNSSFVMLARGDDVPKISARNAIYGTVIERIDGGVNSEIFLDIGAGKTLTAVITKESAEDMPLTVGDRACALFKASHVILAVD
ncbi:TOBE domain-containing protein [Telmatospirillum sp.]|uniref:TOBE domain-containing protein n=1 Tax=Telmatospirillum sp. TaxID=2079197 RepID=UPI00284DF157|nr:TOBE domain-containing protein [Telmatospirillum sp.]MDR3439959.1 TOBE domain-containing protein [Telmatospirillum sp.]